jgi:adenine-specific DNA-methyltransferase
MQKKRRASRLSEGMPARPLDYELAYLGKVDSQMILGGTRARPMRRMSVGTSQVDKPNRLYYGDNLSVLRSLLDDAEVCCKVQLVYIDPPFATGGIFEARNGKHAYEDLAYGSHYLEFLRERLIVLRELLADTGSIYVHLDGKMAFPIKIILDEICGPQNFRNWITRKKSNSKNYTHKQYGNISDYVLFYSKTSECVWNRPFEPWSDQHPPKEYQYVEEETGRRYMKVPVHAPGVRNGETGKEWRGRLPPPGKHWQYPPAILDEMDAKGEIYWSANGNPRRKIYLDQSQGIPAQDIWLGYRDAHNQNIEVTGYPTEKSLEMLQRIVQASSNPGDLVLDCFCGSGTTLVAAEELGRRWIGIDSSREAVSTTLNRLARGSEPMGDYVNGKKQRQPMLFSHPSVLTTSLDLYESDDQFCLSEPTVRGWEKMFPIRSGATQE